MKIRFELKFVDPILSHQCVKEETSNPSSPRRDFNQISSYVALVIALYSLSVEGLAIIGFFLDNQEVKDEQRKIAYPFVEH